MEFADYILSYLLLMVVLHFIYLYYIFSLSLEIMQNRDIFNTTTNIDLDDVTFTRIVLSNIQFNTTY